MATTEHLVGSRGYMKFPLVENFLLSFSSSRQQSRGADTGREVSRNDDQTGHAGCSAAADLQAAVGDSGRSWSSCRRLGPARFSAQQVARRDLYGFGEAFQSRDTRIALPCLDPRDLGRMDAAAVADLLLGQFQALAGKPQVLAEVSHTGDRLCWRPGSP